MLSSHLAWHKDISHFPIKIVPLAEYDFSAWNNYLKEKFQESPKKKIFSVLSELLPRKFSEYFIKNFAENIAEKSAGEIAKTEREKIAKLLGNGIGITLLERRPGDEFVTAGGVNTDEINPKSLESNLEKNLYFAGEIINAD